MINCSKCGFGHRTFEELKVCKSWPQMVAEDTPGPWLQPVADNCILDEHHHEPNTWCQGCADLDHKARVVQPILVPKETINDKDRRCVKRG